MRTPGHVQAGVAPATGRAYRSDLDHFRAWGGDVPATDDQLAAGEPLGRSRLQKLFELVGSENHERLIQAAHLVPEPAIVGDEDVAFGITVTGA